MKVGDLVSWCSKNVQDYGIVLYYDSIRPGYYIKWFGGDGDGWFDAGHPSIGVIQRASIR